MLILGKNNPNLVENALASSGGFQVFDTLFEAPYLLLDNPKLDIEGFVKFHKSIDVVIDLVKTAFHLGEPVPHLFYNRRVISLERSEAPLHCR